MMFAGCRALTLCSLLFTAGADSTDYVQVGMLANATTPVVKMPCNHAVHGFINNGQDVTGLLKSCPVDKPYVVDAALCAQAECMVNPDRETCCRHTTCHCPKGTATLGAYAGGSGATLCASDGDDDCSACDTGYYLSAPAGEGSQTCLPNTCTCTGGTPSLFNGEGAALCTQNGQEDCSKCDPGHTISGQASEGSDTNCVPNTCTCANGVRTVATGNGKTLCEANNEEDCSSCNPGYTLDATAGPGPQTCSADTCSGGLPTGNVTTTDCAQTTTTQECSVSCAPGYAGENTKYTCGANGNFTGTKPTCVAQHCNMNKSAELFTANIAGDHSCDSKTTGESCQVACANGYIGATKTFQCTASGWTGTPMQCTPEPCDASAAPENGNAGDCAGEVALESGTKCSPKCNDGYRLSGQTSCSMGTLTSATCEPLQCEGAAPENGGMGDCQDLMESGTSCNPTCNNGYHLAEDNTTSSCLLGNLTKAVCQAKLQCALQYLKTCNDNSGYWSAKAGHLNYAGCEYFCNLMNTETGGSIKGCELGSVPSDVRTTSGLRCFAHTKACTLLTMQQNAAAACQTTAPAANASAAAAPAANASAANNSNDSNASAASMLAHQKHASKHHKKH